MKTMAVFENIGMNELEPRCSGCRNKLSYGVNTRFDEDRQTMVCATCDSSC